MQPQKVLLKVVGQLRFKLTPFPTISRKLYGMMIIVANGGHMTTELHTEWLNEVFSERHGAMFNQSSLLVDQALCHKGRVRIRRMSQLYSSPKNTLVQAIIFPKVLLDIFTCSAWLVDAWCVRVCCWLPRPVGYCFHVDIALIFMICGIDFLFHTYGNFISYLCFHYPTS